MLDIRWIRENPDLLDRALAKRNAEPAAARLIALDEVRRSLIGKVEEAQQRRNAASKEIGKAKAEKDEATAARLMAEVAGLKTFLADAEAKSKEAEKALEDALAIVPNVPLDDVPVGDETANKVHHLWGELPDGRQNWAKGFKAKEHYELGEKLGQMDFEAAAKLSGSRFVVLKKGLARMERALGQFMLDLHTEEHGYAEVQPPLLVRDEAAFGTGQLPKFKDDLFASKIPRAEPNLSGALNALSLLLDKGGASEPSPEALLDEPNYRAVQDYFSRPRVLDESEEDRRQYLKKAIQILGLRLELERRKKPGDAGVKSVQEFFASLVNDRDNFDTLWLIPTAEVPLTNLVRESILDEAVLPLRYTALTQCFRSEAGAAGKDTRGMLRQHQFDKVELVSITTPEQSRDEHERMLACAEEVLRRLDLHYRVMTLSTGDMGFAAQKTYDIEVWLPGQGTYREISSCSVCGDFQARRMQARYRPKEAEARSGEAATGKQKRANRLVHTLNGSGVAVGRALIAVMENYQNPDGSITVPEVLRSYMRGIERIANSE
jgi:seryl-tRNA synthetase